MLKGPPGDSIRGPPGPPGPPGFPGTTIDISNNTELHTTIRQVRSFYHPAWNFK